MNVDVIIIGGGQAGLAMSRCLTTHGIGHVVLERGRVAERWRTERWDSLRLLTPNWMSRLPDYGYRLPRRYRGRDILWWFDRMGLLDASVEDVYDIEISKQQPSMQLVGRPDHATLSLPGLEAQGVRLTGRVAGIDGTRVRLADDLVAYTAAADIKLAMLRRRIDQHVEASGLAGIVEATDEYTPFCWPSEPPEAIDLRAEGISSVVWATGYRRVYPWLDVPVLDAAGEIRHEGGVTPVPGLYVLGLQFQRRRNSAFIDGVGKDAAYLAKHVAGVIGVPARGGAALANWTSAYSHQ